MGVDARQSNLVERRHIIEALKAELRSGEPPDVLVGSGTEALALTSMLASELGLPMAYLRPKPKEHGRQKRLEGQLHGSRAALILLQATPDVVQDNTELVAAGGSRVAKVIALEDYVAAGPAVSAADVARILLDIGAVIIREEPFRYASGLLSPIYTDCRLLISHPEKWPRVLDALEAKLRATDVDAIVGVTTSGIPHASVLANRLGKPLAYAGEDGVVGDAVASDRLVIVEDLVTTGKSVLETAAALRQRGFKADRCVSIFTYDRQQPRLEAAGIAFEALSDLATLLEVGVGENHFREAERQAVLDWRRDPQAWSAAHEPA